jgi:hypothetical protein
MPGRDNTHSPRATKVSAGGNRAAGDLLIYALIAFGIWAMWSLSNAGLFVSGDDIGYWLGVAGASMMGILFVYPMRKHFKFARNWGKLKGWFVFHMFLGVAGPLLILLHSNFRLGSLNASVALYSMLVVMLSGVVGRFLYVRVNQGLAAESRALERIVSAVGSSQVELHRQLESFPQLVSELEAYEKRTLHPESNSLFAHLGRILGLPYGKVATFRKCQFLLSQNLSQRAERIGLNDKDRSRFERKAARRVEDHLTAVQRVGLLLTYKRLLSTWHVAHIPFVYLLILSAIVHIVAVHAY